MPFTTKHYSPITRMSLRLSLAVLIAGLAFSVTAIPGRTQGSASISSEPTGKQPLVIPECRVELIDSVNLAAESSGVLDLVAPQGKQVAKGELVAHVRDAFTRMALTIAEKRAANDVEIRFAQKSHELEELKYMRSLTANRKFPGTVSDIDLREQRLSAEKTLLLLEQSRNDLAIHALERDEAKQRLKSHRVEAPFAGMIREVHKRAGESTTSGETILELVNTGRMQVVGDVPLHEVDDIHVGTPVTVSVSSSAWGRNGKPVRLTGKIAFIDVELEPVTNTVKCGAEVTNTGGILRAGMTATMKIHHSASRSPAGGKTAATHSGRTGDSRSGQRDTYK